MKILKLLKSVVVQEAVSCFRDLKATHSQIAITGNIIMLRIYNGKDDDTLTSLRHADCHLMTMGKKKLKPETLPPTERAVYFQSLRVHLQICQWATLNLQCLDPTEWGWKLENNIDPRSNQN